MYVYVEVGCRRVNHLLGRNMKTKYYIANAVTGTIFGFLGYLSFIFLESRDYHSIWATIASLIGFSIGIASITFLRKKRPDIYNSPSLTIWTALLINLNLFFGIFLGLGVGFIASYILFLILSAIFGHPERHKWSGGFSYGFMLIALVITSYSVISFARSSFTHGTRFVERRIKT